MTINNQLKRKHYVIGGMIIAIAFVVQPFSLLFVQANIAPILAPLLTGQNADGSMVVEGKEISNQNLKIRGDANAEIMLVEYSDYECPFCNRFHDTPKQIVESSNGKVSWAWKHFPLTQIHPNAQPASVAAECVNKLSGAENFWKFSDMLINNQQILSENFYIAEASKLGINANNFSTCLKDPAMAEIVSKDLSEGESLGVSGTPSTFVVRNENGKLTILENINGALPKETVESIIAKYSK